MAFLRCPQCQNVVEAPTAGQAKCPRCGFAALVPPATAGGLPQHPVGAPFASPPYATRPASTGRPRSFWTSLLLGIVTLGIYFLIWNYKAFEELDREHGERHAGAWFWAYLALAVGSGIVLVVASAIAEAGPDAGKGSDVAATLVFYAFLLAATAVFLAYTFREISRLERYRQTRGLPEGLAPVWFLLLYIGGMFLFAVPTMVAYFLLQKSINEVWWNVYTQRQIPWPL